MFSPGSDSSELRSAEELKDSIIIPDEELVAEYYEYKKQLEQMASDFKLVITHPTYSLPFLQGGRLVRIKYQQLDFGWGVILGYRKTNIIRVRSPTCFAHKL